MARTASRRSPTRRAPARRAPRRSPVRRTRAKRADKKYKVELSAEEREVLRRAARRYRAQLPTYLVSNQAEARLLRAVLRKL